MPPPSGCAASIRASRSRLCAMAVERRRGGASVSSATSTRWSSPRTSRRIELGPLGQHGLLRRRRTVHHGGPGSTDRARRTVLRSRPHRMLRVPRVSGCAPSRLLTTRTSSTSQAHRSLARRLGRRQRSSARCSRWRCMHLLVGVEPATQGAALSVDLRTLEVRREIVPRDEACEVCRLVLTGHAVRTSATMSERAREPPGASAPRTPAVRVRAADQSEQAGAPTAGARQSRQLPHERAA